MHEMTVATSLVEEILRNLKSYKDPKVEEVCLEIGELAFISEMQLEFCYNILAKEHEALKGSKLRIEKVRAEVRCTSCDHSGGLDGLEEPIDHRMIMTFACPRCGSTLEIIKGRDMILKNISAKIEE